MTNLLSMIASWWSRWFPGRRAKNKPATERPFDVRSLVPMLDPIIVPRTKPDVTHVIASGLAPPVDAELPKPVRRRRPPRQRDVFLKSPTPPVAPMTPRSKREKRTVLHSAGPDLEPEPKPGHWGFRREDVEQAGTFFFRGALLDHLDRYFRVIARMKHSNRPAYDLYSQIGATLVPDNSLFANELPAYWHDREQRPGFGAIAMSLHRDDTEKTWWPRMMIYEKMELPPQHVEPVPDTDDVFQIEAYFDASREANEPKAPKYIRKGGFVFVYHVAVDPQCRIRLLKHLQTRYHHVRYRASTGQSSNNPNSTNGHSGKTKLFNESIPFKLWDYPEFLKDWYDDNKKRHRLNDTVDSWSCGTLIQIAELGHAGETGVRIQVTDKHGNSATFAVDPKRMAYFFKDRDLILTERGTKARIFHIVRPHQRTLKSGKVLDLKMHFRGLRKFTWAGYTVHLTMPGLHHKPIWELATGSVDEKAAKALGMDIDRMLTQQEHGQVLSFILHGQREEAERLLDSKG